MKFEEIEEIICSEIGITPDEFKSGRNKAEFVAAKTIFIHFASLVSINKPKIAEYVNQRESTLYLAAKRYDDRMLTDRVFRNITNTIKEKLNV